MTDKLKQEAEEWVKDHSGLIGSYEYVKYDYDSLIQAYLASAEPREKRIAELQYKLDTLQGFLDHDIEYDMDKTIQEQKIKIVRLEAQIEKMKCCIVSCCEGCERLPKLYKEIEKEIEK